MIVMTTNKPYLIRAIYEWIVDNELTPYILSDADYPGLDFPREYISDGKIVFNISPEACRNLELGIDRITFTARFGDNPVSVSLLPGAVLAIYAKENGQGMEFKLEEPDPHNSSKVTVKNRKPTLTLVKKK